MQKFLLVTMQPTDTAPILLFELADKSEIKKSDAYLREQFDSYDQENWIKTNPRLVEHIGFGVAVRAEINMNFASPQKLALSILDSEKGPIIDAPEIIIPNAFDRPVVLSLSIDGIDAATAEKRRHFHMRIGMRILKELWALYQSERQAA